jgi:hypothetical protein
MKEWGGQAPSLALFFEIGFIAQDDIQHYLQTVGWNVASGVSEARTYGLSTTIRCVQT